MVWKGKLPLKMAMFGLYASFRECSFRVIVNAIFHTKEGDFIQNAGGWRLIDIFQVDQIWGPNI